MVVQFHDGKVLFDSGVVAFDPACCCGEAECDECSGTIPEALQVDLFTFEGLCLEGNDCFDEFEGPYILDWVSACAWRYNFPSEVCSVDRLTANVASGGATMTVQLRGSGGFPIMIWSVSIPSSICSSMNEELGLIQTNTLCGAQPESCKVTAL